MDNKDISERMIIKWDERKSKPQPEMDIKEHIHNYWRNYSERTCIQLTPSTYYSPSLSLSHTYLSSRRLPLGQERGKGALQHVRVAANGVGRVAIVGALSVEAQIVRGRDEECLQQIILRHLVNLCGDI